MSQNKSKLTNSQFSRTFVLENNELTEHNNDNFV